MVSISVEALKALIDANGDIFLLDVREPWEFELCHIEGSKNIPMLEINEKMDTLDKDREFVVLCHHGMRSLQVAHFLKSAGIEKVSNLDGGIAAWSARIDPNMPQY